MIGAIGIHANRIKSGEKMWLSWCIKIKSVTFLYINPAKRNVFNLKNEMCKNKEKRNAQNSYTSNKHKSSLFGLLLL